MNAPADFPASPHSAGSAHHPGGVTPPPKRQRRWWVYALWTFAGLFALGVMLVISVMLYVNHLVKTYTSAKPAELPKIEASQEKFDELEERWHEYSLQFLKDGERPEIELSEEDLNVLLARRGPMRERAYVQIFEDRMRLQFSMPMGQGGNQVRYLNGEATLKVQLANGRISARMLDLRANGKVVPGWLFQRFQRMNWLEQMNWRPETDMVVRGLERIETKAGAVVLHPKAVVVMLR